MQLKLDSKTKSKSNIIKLKIPSLSVAYHVSDFGFHCITLKQVRVKKLTCE